MGKKTIESFNGNNSACIPFSKIGDTRMTQKKVFTVKDGVIRISGEEWGCITTDIEYENHRLTTEFK